MLLRYGPRIQARGLVALGTCQCRSTVRTLTTGKDGENKASNSKESTEDAMDMLAAMLDKSPSKSKSTGSNQKSSRGSDGGVEKKGDSDKKEDEAINLLAAMLEEDKGASKAAKPSRRSAADSSATEVTQQDVLGIDIFTKQEDVKGGNEFLSDLLSGKVEKEKIAADSIFKSVDEPSKNRLLSPTAKKLPSEDLDDEDGWVNKWQKIAKEQHNQIPKAERPLPKPRPELVEGVGSDAEEVEADLKGKEKVWLQNLMSKVKIAVERNPTYNKTQRQTMIESFRQIDTKNQKSAA